MAGGIEIEAVALPAVRAVSTAPTTRGCAWRSWSGRGITRLERAGSQPALRAAGDQCYLAATVSVCVQVAGAGETASTRG